MKSLKKIFSGAIIASLLLLMNSSFVYADFSYPSPSEAATQGMDGVMNDMGVDKDSMKNLVKQINTLDQKTNQPTVTLNFSPSTPTAGQKVTATAEATYFMNQSEQLYYTWFIKHKTDDGKKTRHDSFFNKDITCDGDGNCDLNGDSKITLEDYKIEAMRAIANGGFDWQSASYSSDPDSDGYDAVFGGDDQRGKGTDGPHCYVHEISSGKDSEITCEHLFPHDYSMDASGKVSQPSGNPLVADGNGFKADKERFWHTDPTANSTNGSGTLDEAAVAGLGEVNFSWYYQTGDKVGVAVEGVETQPTSYSDSTYKTMWALLGSCGDVETTTPDSTSSSSSSSSISDGVKTVTKTETKTTYDSAGDTLTIDSSGSYKATTTTTTTTQTFYSVNSCISSSSSSSSDDICNKVNCSTCTDASGGNGDSTGCDSTCDTDGDGYNNSAYSTTSSSSSSTSDTSTPVQAKDSSSLRTCMDTTPDDFMLEPSEGSSATKITVDLSSSPDSPMNDTSGSGDGDTLSLQSSVTGTAGNSSSANYAWKISLASSISADTWTDLTKDETGLQQTSGIGLTSIKLPLNFTSTFLENKGLSKTSTFYLKARLDVSETSSGSTTKKSGNSEIIIPINPSSSKIQVYSTTVSGGKLSRETDKERCDSGMDSVTCPIAKDEIVGMKVALDPKDYDLLWTLDGTSLPFPSSIGNCSSDSAKDNCDDNTSPNYSNAAYFPVLKDTGSKYAVSLTATGKEGTPNVGETISLTKNFEVSEPTVKISSNDETACKGKLLGNYIDTNGTKWPDYSTTTFEALQGSTITLSPVFNTPFSSSSTWAVDGADITSENATELGFTLGDDGSISFPASKVTGDSYSVGISALYVQSNDVKNALNQNWGVSLASFYEKQLGASIQINVVDALSGFTTAKANSARPKILASLFSGIPSYINFLFRIVLTIALILFTTGIIFTLFPKPQEN